MKRRLLTNLVTFSSVALVASSARAVVVFSDDFESPDVTAAQSSGTGTGATSKLADPAKWVRATQGFGASTNGLVDEGAGFFTDPVGQQAYGFGYTNSGVTTAPGVIGVLELGATYNISFDVVQDLTNAPGSTGTPWRVKLVVFEDGLARNDVRNNNGSTVLYEANGNATEDGLYTNISFSFSPDEIADAGSLNKDLALRFIGATNSATIDNVIVDVIPPGEEFFLKLLVDTTTGQTTLAGRPDTGTTINYYQISSAGNSLDSVGWNSLADQDYEGNGPANGSRNGWEEAGGSGPHALGDGYLLGSSTIPAGAEIDLGTAYNPAVDAQDLAFVYRTADGLLVDGVVEYVSSAIPGDTDGDGDIDDADLGTSFSNYTGPGGSGKTAAQGDTDGDGDVDDADLGVSFANYTGPLGPAVPEPASAALLVLGGLGLMRRR